MGATKEFLHNEIEEEQRKAISDTRDYPVLFSTDMVRAILSGSKTVTRRLFLPLLSVAMEPAHEIWHDGVKWIARLKNGKCYKKPIVCPFGEPGDYLWVKETWAPAIDDIAYRADYSEEVLAEKRNQGLWKPSIHMQKTQSRLWLQITDIKAQRIQTITEEEAREEGIQPGKIYWFDKTNESNFREGFLIKWFSIYGIENYYENPWVWAIKFNVAESKPSKII
jgi:hypothetical protein